MYQATAKVHVRRKAIIENRWANVFAIRTPTKVTIPRARRVMRFESFNDEIAQPPWLSVDPPSRFGPRGERVASQTPVPPSLPRSND
jgi:hypothetical protein